MFTPSSTPATHQSTITQPPDQTDTSSIEYIPSYGNSIRGRGHSSASNQSNDDIESNPSTTTPRQRLQSQDVDDLKIKYQFRKTKQSSIFSTCFGNMKRTLISMLILIFILSSLYFVVLQRRRVSNPSINSPTNVGNTHNVVKSQIINENVKSRNEILDQKEKKYGILQVKKKKTKKEDDELIDEKSLDELLREDKKPKKEKKQKKEMKIKPKKKIPQIVKKKQVVYQGQEKKAKHDEVIEKYLKLIDEKKPKKKKPTLDEDLKNHPLLQLDPEPFIPKKKVEQPKEKPLEKKKVEQPTVAVEIPKKEEKKQEKNEPVAADVEKEIKNPNTDAAAAVPVEDKKDSKEGQIAKEQPKEGEIPKVETPKVEEKKTETPKVEDESVKDVKPESVEEEEVQNPKIETPTKSLEKTKEPAKIETPKKKKPIEKKKAKKAIKKKLPKKKKEIKKKPAKKEKQPKKELDDATLLATHPLFQDDPHPYETPKDEPKKDQAKEAEKKPEEPKKDKKRVNKYPVKANKKPKKAIIKKKAIKKPAKKVIKKPKIVKPKKAAVGKKKDEATEQDFSKHPLFQEEPHTFVPPTKEDLATEATPEKKGTPPQLPSDLTDANIKEYLSAYRAYHGSLEGIEKGMDKKQAKKIVSFIEKEYSK